MHRASTSPVTSSEIPASAGTPRTSETAAGLEPSYRAEQQDRPHLLTPSELARMLSIRDLTDPAQGHHALQLLVDKASTALTSSWDSEPRQIHTHPVTSLDDNYERLGFPADAVTRDARYTRYVSESCVLRSHASAAVPGALRQLAADAARDTAPSDVLLVCPGMCYRRDSVDWQHSPTPHQLDLWRIHGKHRMRESDLREMIERVMEAVLPGQRWRAEPRTHPYTSRGRQIDVRADGDWVEVGETGLVAGPVLARAGLAPRWSGLAMGLGLDRLLMLHKGIGDIRLLRAQDPRIAEQMLDLAPYRPVSHMPPIRRDLSVAVGAEVDTSAEALGDRVRAALGTDSTVVETVRVLSRTDGYAVPESARERLGMRPHQHNLLVRLVLRALDRTLTDAEANELRDQVYAKLHEGSVGQWTALQPD